VAEEVRAGRTSELDELHDDLVRHTVALLADESTARKA
jgi:hypothetical protein